MRVGERFSMANLQLREARLGQLIAQLQSYHRPIAADSTAAPAQTSLKSVSGLPGTEPASGFSMSASTLGVVPTQEHRSPEPAGKLLQHPMLG